MDPIVRKRVVLVAAALVIAGSLTSIAWQLFARESKPANPGNIVPAYHYPGGGSPPWMKDRSVKSPSEQPATRPKPS